MTVDLRLERLYQRIELVKGIGEPRRGKLCIMSLVALLASEAHSDSPAAASPVIRRFVIPINDRMPAPLRQRLKPFAPRIIGTRDDLDRVRAGMLARAMREEIAPRVQADFGTPTVLLHWLGRAGEVRAAARTLETRLEMLAARPMPLATPDIQVEIAGTTADLLALCASAAPDPGVAGWYWNKAIELLDRLCDIRDGCAAPPVDAGRLAWLETALARRERLQRRVAMASRTMDRLRRLLPLWSDAGAGSDAGPGTAAEPARESWPAL